MAKDRARRILSKVVNPPAAGAIDGDEQLIKALIIDQVPGGESTQLTEEERAWEQFGGEVIKPPINPMAWAFAMERSTRLATSIRKYARNTVGLGWEVVPTPDNQIVLDAKDDDLDAAGKKLKAELPAILATESALVKSVLVTPNPKMTFTRLLELWKIDEEATGNGYIEVVRSLDNKISSMFHVHSANVRILKGASGYVQIIGGEKRFFKNFGDVRVVNNETGKVFAPDDEMTVLPLKQRASELIHTKIYSPRSPFYGIPRYVSTAPAIAGSRLSAEKQAAFFENDCVPRIAVIVNGGRLDGESFDMLKKFFQKGKGAENAGRAMLLQAVKKQSGLQKPDDVKIEVKPLTVGIVEDASHQNYRKNNDEELREVFGIDRSFFTTEGVNKASAVVGRAITIEQEFIPDITEKEFLLNRTIIAGLGVSHVCLRLKRPRIASEDSEARTFAMLIPGGGITPNDIRRLLKRQGFDGFEPIAEEWADQPMELARAVLQSQVAGQSTQAAASAAQAAAAGAAAAATPSAKAAYELVRSLQAFTGTVDKLIAAKNGVGDIAEVVAP